MAEQEYAKQEYAKQKYLTARQFGTLVARAWQDDSLRVQLEKNPTETIRAFAQKEFGIDLECALQIHSRPEDLSDEQIATLADGNAPNIHALDSGILTMC
jgi:hypothetical protein